MRKRKIQTLLITAIILFELFIGVVSAQPNKIKYQTDENYPPFAYRKDGELMGFDFELARLMFTQSSYEAEYSADVFALVYDRLVKGEIDAAGLIAVKEERKKDILYSDPVLHSYIGVYTKSDGPNLKINDLKNYKIGVGRGFYTEEILRERAGVTYYYTYDNVEAALLELKKGSIDAVFGNQEAINYLIITKGLQNLIIQRISNIYPFELAIGIKKTNPELVYYINTQLKHLKQSGAFELLYQKYFLSNSPEHYKRRIKNLIIIITAILFILIAIVIFLKIYINKLRNRIIKSNQEIMLQKAYFKQLFESSPQATVMLDMDDNILDVNAGFEKLYGYKAEEVKDKKLSNIIIPKGNETQGEQINNLILKGTFYQEEAKRARKDGSIVDVSILGYPIIYEGHKIGVYGIYTDISERIRQEEIVKYQACFDSLTNLPNRRVFMEKLDDAIDRAKNKNKIIAVIFIDLDRFKAVNDSLGHNIGDKLLAAVGARLSNTVKSVDLVARMGGDEFIIMLEEIERKDMAFRIIERIDKAINLPYIIDGNEICITASIGVSYYPQDGEDGETILIKSDNKMYAEKNEKQKYAYNLDL